MAKIGILHTDLTVQGGGDGLCVNIIEALQQDHSVELLSLTEPDFETLNEYFGTGAEAITVRQISNLGTKMWSLPYSNLGLLVGVFLQRGANKHGDKYDLIISTVGEFNLKAPSVQYIHYPRHAYRRDNQGDRINSVYQKVCETLTNYTPENVVREANLIANSKYTNEIVKEIYPTNPDVIYPPVDTTDLKPMEWSEREEGFVSVGSIIPEKRQLHMIDILRGVRDCGHEVHYHIVGPMKDSEYSEKVRSECEKLSWITFEGKVTRERVTHLLTSHKYAIHGMPNEHFGIAVAEMVAAGAITFVPNDGGQCEIVGENERMIYKSKHDAISKIDSVVNNPDMIVKIKSGLPNVEEQFGKQRFHRQIREKVTESLSKAGEE